jgi:hypothetical protein
MHKFLLFPFLFDKFSCQEILKQISGHTNFFILLIVLLINKQGSLFICNFLVLVNHESFNNFSEKKGEAAVVKTKNGGDFCNMYL